MLVGALLVVALLIAGGVFAVVKLTSHHNPANAPIAAGGGGAAKPAAANTGPFTGTYRVQFGQGTSLDGSPAPGAVPTTETYGVRSACGGTGCVATAARLTGETTYARTTVFDQVDGHWLAVAIGSDKCRDSASEIWEVFTLQPGPNGTFTGDYTATAANLCGGKHTVTFTRTGDIDISTLPDPAALPARVVSPAEALHGSYRQKPNVQRQGPPAAVRLRGDHQLSAHRRSVHELLPRTIECCGTAGIRRRELGLE